MAKERVVKDAAATEAPAKKSAPKKSPAKKSPAKKIEAAGTIKLALVRSPIGYPKNQKLTVRTLGLSRMNQVIEKADTPENRSMAGSVPHLIKIVE